MRTRATDRIRTKGLERVKKRRGSHAYGASRLQKTTVLQSKIGLTVVLAKQLYHDSFRLSRKRLGTLRKTRRQRQRESHQTNGLMSKSIGCARAL